MAKGTFGGVGNGHKKVLKAPTSIFGYAKSTSTRPIPVGSALSSSTKTGWAAPAPAAATAAPRGGGGGGAGYVAGSAQPDPRSIGEHDRMRGHIDSIRRGPDPNLQTQVDRLAGRLSSDTLDRAINRSSDALRDQGEAQKAALAGGMASRGFGSDSGVGQQANERIDARTQRLQAGTSADLALANEGRLDRLVLGGQGIMRDPGQYGLSRDAMIGGMIQGSGQMATDIDRGRLAREQLGLEAYKTDRGFDLAEQDQGLAQWLALMRSLGGGGGYGGGYGGGAGY